MEQVKIIKEIKFLESINKWCVGIWANREPKHSIWTGGFFHKDKQKAENEAMQSFTKSLNFWREVEKPLDEKQELTLII